MGELEGTRIHPNPHGLMDAWCKKTLRISTAVVLAGGRGLRLAPLTDNLPKALVRIRSRPLLEWVIEWLARNRVEDLIVGVAYEKEKIMNYFGDGSRFGVRITYSSHSVEGGTAEGFRRAITGHVTDHIFLSMNGDELTNLNVEKLTEIHLSSGALATLAVTQFKSPFGIVRLDSNDRVVDFEEKAKIPNTYVSIGVYAFRREILDYIPESGDIERTTFPTLSRMDKLQAYKHDGFWMTVNSLKELQEAEENIDRIFSDRTALQDTRRVHAGA
jgi:NDP-sugar pyrophosphorylase family protein